MSITPTQGVIFNNITTTSDQYAAVATSKGAGLLTFDINESTMTNTMMKELIGATISVYTLVNGVYIQVRSRVVLWNTHKDRAIPMYSIPRQCYLKITPILDKRMAMWTDENNVTHYDIVPELYIKMSESERIKAQQHLDTTFPVTVSFDGTIINGSGGGAATLDGEIIDNPTSDDTVSSAQVYNFINDIDDLTYDE